LRFWERTMSSGVRGQAPTTNSGLTWLHSSDHRLRAGEQACSTRRVRVRRGRESRQVGAALLTAGGQGCGAHAPLLVCRQPRRLGLLLALFPRLFLECRRGSLEGRARVSPTAAVGAHCPSSPSSSPPPPGLQDAPRCAHGLQFAVSVCGVCVWAPAGATRA
jgi:hypothetical protein